MASPVGPGPQVRPTQPPPNRQYLMSQQKAWPGFRKGIGQEMRQSAKRQQREARIRRESRPGQEQAAQAHPTRWA